MLDRLVREKALILGVIVAAFGLLVAFGVDLTEAQIGAAVTFVGAVVALLRFAVTPSREVLAQVKPSGEVVAGQASAVETGASIPVSLDEPAVTVPLPVDPDAP